MRVTKMYLPTLREAPAEAEVLSHQLMLRAGMIRKLAAGIYTWLPLGLRVLRKVEQIIRQEMDRAGAQEVFMPMVQPAELWRESGRWEAYGPELARMKDRHGREFCLGPTHEEVITDLVRGEVRSYRDLPLNLYQIQDKFRDEVRPRFGVMRGREFGMKDAYSFDADDAGAEKSYKEMYDAYTAIFTRCGLHFQPVEAMTGQIGGSFSHEFMVLADTGESGVIVCDACGYAATLEKAETSPADPAGAGGAEGPLTRVHTPGAHTVEQVAEFLKVPASRIAKTLIYETNIGPIAAIVRGDRELNVEKLTSVTGAYFANLAEPRRIEELTGGPVGFSGPSGLKLPLYLDRELAGAKDLVIGANEQDQHYTNANEGRDFKPTAVADIKLAAAGDPCPRCAKPLRLTRGIEVGQVFKLGTKYSKAMNASFLDKDGKEQLMVMGCYGIGTGRTVAAAVEQNHDEHGIIWPVPLAPFQVYLLPINLKDQDVAAVTDKLYADLQAAGIDVLLDDRDERAGVKFNDADLLGIPLRIVLSGKNLKNGKVEVKGRKETEAKLVDVDQALDAAKEFIATGG
jgi:prolyl-tRNA synthetase